MSYNVLLEGVLRDSGGCGRYQWVLSVIVHAVTVCASWSMLTMSFAGQDPGFRCSSRLIGRNATEAYDVKNISDACASLNKSTCSGFIYDNDMHTLVAEYDLVCDRKWIAATITTIQMAGAVVASFVAGHVADTIGRKPTFFLAIFTLVVFNAVAVVAPSWPVYAAIRFVIGLGIGFFLTVQFNVVMEFIVEPWRPRLVAVPSWALGSSLFALVAWAFHDWRHVHIACAAAGAPFLLTWRNVPESFRWSVTKQRFAAAENVIRSMAKLNRRTVSDLSDIIAKEKKARELEKVAGTMTYTVLDVFRNSTSITLGLMFIWFAISTSYYGLTFGIQNLSGNLYLNMFLVNVVEAPATFMMMFFANRIGRTRTCMVFFMLSGLCGVAIGTLQYVDTPVNGDLTNAFAYVSKLSIGCGWGALIVLTTELYPTVVRTISYGLHNTSARVGGMVAPQIVFLNDSVPGLLFFLSGGLMIASTFVCVIFPETKGKILQDTYFVEESESRKDQDELTDEMRHIPLNAVIE